MKTITDLKRALLIYDSSYGEAVKTWKDGIACITASAQTAEIIASSFLNPLQGPATAEDPLPNPFVWMPAGNNEIEAATIDDCGYKGKAICDEQAFRAVSAHFQKIIASGKRVWIDLNHDDGAAAAWVKAFSWDPAKGIMAHVEWTPRGESALRGKEFYSFSPTFGAEIKTGRVAQLLDDHAAGGLVNKPAFSAMPALIAAHKSGKSNKTAPGGTPEQETDMKDLIVKLLAALKITPPADATEDQLVALFAQHQKAAADSGIAEVTALKKQIEDAQKTELATAKQELAAVTAAQKAAKTEADKAAAELAEIKATLAAIKAGATAGGAGPGIVQVIASVEDLVKGYAKLDPRRQAHERGVLYQKEIAPVIARMGSRQFSIELDGLMPKLSGVAEITANTLGGLTGNLIAQMALSLLKYEFPMLRAVTTDFSNLSAFKGQTIKTRLKGALSASQYSGGSSGYTAAAATTTDVDVTIDHAPYCQVAFDANELASTNRDLFGEQSEVVQYAIALDIVNALYALIIAANFTTTPLKLGTGTTGEPYRRVDAIAAAKQLFVNKVPRKGRFNLLNADAFGGLATDSAIVSLAAFQKAEIIQGYELPPIADMQPIQAVNLPFTGGMVGFAFHPRALALATRVPNDYTTALQGSNYGSVSQVTDPDTGITVMVTQYVNHDKGTSNYRVALLYGVAVGDPVAGVITEEASGS